MTPPNLFAQIEPLRFPAPLPKTLLVVEQRFDAPRVADIPAAVAQALAESGILARIRPGQSVALGVGSRGIANLPTIVKATVDALSRAGAEPFIVPAMGSHGGATAEGQKEMLASLGVTEEAMGAPIHATMEVVEIGRIPGGPPLFQGKDSQAADHTILVSRIKPHTDFRGKLESGPSKMAVIGLGKQRGAAAMHSGGGRNFQRYLAPAARIYQRNTNLLGAVGIVENAYDETAAIVGLTAEEIGGPKEEELLELAKKLLASLPFPAIDVLVVQRLGKDISGTGMDTNVIGRLMIPRQPEEFGDVDVAVIALLDMTEASHGNAAGMGLANVTTARLVRKVDWAATYTNSVTSGIFGMQRVHMPITMADDQRALEVALRGCAEPPETARMVFIRDTLTLDRLWVSPSLRAAVAEHPRLAIAGEVPLSFQDGVMTSPWTLEG